MELAIQLAAHIKRTAGPELPRTLLIKIVEAAAHINVANYVDSVTRIV